MAGFVVVVVDPAAVGQLAIGPERGHGPPTVVKPTE
jgi:hypothetical protein